MFVPVVSIIFAGLPRMLTDIYIQALLVDEVLADQVWEVWDAGLIPDDLAAIAWCILAMAGNNEGTQ